MQGMYGDWFYWVISKNRLLKSHREIRKEVLKMAINLTCDMQAVTFCCLKLEEWPERC